MEKYFRFMTFIEKEKKEQPIKDFFFTIQCKLEKLFIDNPRDFKNNIKWFIQRGKRGYSDRDLWSFDWYLAEIPDSQNVNISF